MDPKPTFVSSASHPDSAVALLSQLQTLLSRHASPEEIEQWVKTQSQRVTASSEMSSAVALPQKRSPLPVGPLPPVPLAAHHVGMDAAHKSSPVAVACSPTRLTGHRPMGASSPSLAAAAGAALPPITDPPRRAEIESVLSELFTRSGPGGEIGRKKVTPHQHALYVDGTTTTPVPPATSAAKKSGAAFARRGLGALPSATPPAAASTPSLDSARLALGAGPLKDDVDGATDADAPPIPPAPVRPPTTTTTTTIATNGATAAAGVDPLNGLPQVLHVADIAAQVGGASARSINTSSSLGGSSALLGYINAGSPMAANGSRGSMFASGNESHLSVLPHANASPANPDFRPSRSVLNVSEYLTAEENPIINGALPMFGSDEGPQFTRVIFNRRVPVYVSVEETKAALTALNVPVLEDVLNAADEVDIVKCTLECGLDRLFVVTSLNVLLRYGFVKRLRLDVTKLHAFLTAAATFFREGNPFHHPFHASDVIIAAHQWLTQPTAASHLSDMEIFAFLFSAIVMRIGHCGADNDFLAQLHHPFATVFGYSAPQQGATMALVLALLDQPANHFLPPLAFAAPTLLLTKPSADTEDPDTTAAGSALNGSATLTDLSSNWTSSVELEFLDMVSDLVLASDERNHADHVANMAHIAAEHFLLHGCVCQGRPREEKDAMTSPCPVCCAYIEDKDVPQLLKALLHFVDFCFLFRPYPIYVTGACMHTAELYRQAAYRAQLLDTITTAMESRGTDGALAAAAAAMETPMSADDPSAQNLPWRPAMTRTSIVATLRSHRARGGGGGAATNHSTSELTSISLDTPSSQMAATDDDELLDDLSQLLGPLRGYGRDLLFVGVEALYYPNLDATGPYLPKSWVSAFFANHHQMLSDNPSAIEYDAAIERVFRLGHKKSALSTEAAAEAAKGTFYRAACYDVVEQCGLRVEPRWSIAADATHVKRVLREILSPLMPAYI